ncbi:MAG: sulfatase [Chloroflexi bacterium]|nr:sulfatase [Chloroflexota bacterium]OJV90107.1 MAG: sulfatase [Chloroflexi bacterium 54-19]
MPNSSPNILFISTHDINPDLGCYAGVWPGADYAHTPNLDRMAAEGLLYENAFATTPVCAPSRSAIITGMFPTAIGTMHMRSNAVPPPEVHCFPEYLRAAGYYCTNNFFLDYQFQSPVTVFDENSPTAHWRNRPDPDQPFYAAFHGMVTHESQIYVKDEIYQKNTARLKPEERHDPALAPVPPYYPNTPTFQEAVARYSDNITAMDYWVGDLLDQLEEDGLADNTLVVFWSDHGRGFPREKRWPYEAGLHVPLIVRWPGKIAPGSVYQTPVCTMDLAATMLEAAGLEVPGHMQARPLFDRAGQLNPNPRPFIFGHRDRMGETEDTVRTVRDSRFHYMRNYHPDRPYAQHQDYAETTSTWRELRRFHWEESQYRGAGIVKKLLTPAQHRFMASSKPPEELYDIQADPYELDNLADNPAYAADMVRLRQALDEWEASFPDLGMLPEEELLLSWRPNGEFEITEVPLVKSEGGRLEASCPTEGASIGWTTEPPTDAPPKSTGLWNLNDEPPTGGRHWQFYNGPFSPPQAETIWFRAHRLGFLQSADVAVKLG